MKQEHIDKLIEFINAPKFQSGLDKMTDADFQRMENLLNEQVQQMQSGNIKVATLALTYEDAVFLWSCVHNCHNLQTASVGILQGEHEK